MSATLALVAVVLLVGESISSVLIVGAYRASLLRAVDYAIQRKVGSR